MAEDSPTLRSLVIGLVTLLLVALIIGGVFSLFALGAAKVTGLSSSTSPPPPSMYVPPLTHHHSSAASPTAPSNPEVPAAQSPTSAPAGASPSRSPHPHKKRHHHHAHKITLSASPSHASPSQRIDLSGSYPGGGGATLQVQNRQGGQWTSFPVNVTVSGSTFHTYIYSGNPGRHLFRVLDTGSGKASNTVAITIG